MSRIYKRSATGALLLSTMLFGCAPSEETDAARSDTVQTDTESTDPLNWVVLTGGVVGETAIGSTIEGTDYPAGSGVKCQWDRRTPAYLRIDAQSGSGGLASQLLLQFWNFRASETERDESFDLVPPQAETFRLSADIYDGTDLFIYRGLATASEHLAQGATCHTSFTDLETVVAGTTVCKNLSEDFGVVNLTIQFSCEITPF